MTKKHSEMPQSANPRVGYRHILGLIRGNVRWVTLAVVLTLFGSLLGIAQPLVVREVIDSAGTTNVAWTTLAVLALLFVGQAAVRAVGQFVLQRTSEMVVLGIRQRLIGRLLRLRMEAYHEHRVGDLMSRTSADATAVRRVISEGVTDLITGVVGLVGTVALMIWLDWLLFLIVLLDRTPYSGWLRQQAQALTDPRVSDRTPDLGWGFFSVMAPWATPEAVDAVRRLIVRHAEGAEPLSPIHGMHEDLSYMRAGSRYTGQLSRAADRHGLTLHAPYYDNRVIEAALSIRPQDRVSRWAYKPIMAEAMRGIVPMPALRRDTKGEGSAAEDKGIETHREEVLDFLADSQVAKLGLVDHDHILRECAHPSGSPNDLGRDLYPMIAAEIWLRQATATKTQPAPAP